MADAFVRASTRPAADAVRRSLRAWPTLGACTAPCTAGRQDRSSVPTGIPIPEGNDMALPVAHIVATARARSLRTLECARES